MIRLPSTAVIIAVLAGMLLTLADTGKCSQFEQPLGQLFQKQTPMYFRISLKSGEIKKISAVADAKGRILLRREEVPADALSVSFHDSYFTAETGEKGWFLSPDYWYSTSGVITEFRKRDNTESKLENGLPLYACGKGESGLLAVVSGMSYEYQLVIGVKDGHYYLYPEFTSEKGIYEDIAIRYMPLKGTEATPSGAARRYRRYQLENGFCRTLKERIRTQPVLKDSLEGPEIRIRMAWKPMPPKILEQSNENQPPLHVAITFAGCEKLIRALSEQGIDKAELCLVGWNYRGHDGQFPDLLPVEPALGGEKALKHLTAMAGKYGYRIGAHTNLLDSYSSAGRFQMSDMIVDKDGKVALGGKWSGGQSYFICPRQAAEKFLEEDLDLIERLGFNGTHYFDVFTISRLLSCFHPDHPLTRREAAYWRGKMMKRAQERLGASSSEGRLDYAVGSFDYALYASFSKKYKLPAMCDRSFPFWPIVYHGILHYNSFAETVNAPIKKDKTLAFLNLAWGGQPVFYFYSKFRENSPLGQEDLICDTEEQLRKSTAIIAEDYQRYRTLRDLQYVFIDDIEEPVPNVWITRYADGTITVINGSSQTYHHQNKIKVKPYSIHRMNP